jgi:hypothetical protein
LNGSSSSCQGMTYLKAKADGVDGNNELSSEVLKGTREKCLREEETANPEDGRYTMVNPSLNEFHPLYQISDPRGQRFQTWICLNDRSGMSDNDKERSQLKTYGFAPHDWHGVVEQTLGHFFESLREHHQAFHGFEQFL